MGFGGGEGQKTDRVSCVMHPSRTREYKLVWHVHELLRTTAGLATELPFALLTDGLGGGMGIRADFVLVRVDGPEMELKRPSRKQLGAITSLSSKKDFCLDISTLLRAEAIQRHRYQKNRTKFAAGFLLLLK